MLAVSECSSVSVWDDNYVGIEKDDYDTEDEYKQAVSEKKDCLWPDNDLGIDKDDYDTAEEYRDAVKDMWDLRF